MLILLLIQLCIIGMPIFWGICLYRYLSAWKQCKLVGGEYWNKELSHRKTMLIVASIVLGCSFGVALGFIALLATSVAYM